MIMPPKLSLYIHFPWCVSKCPYCDFNSHELKYSLNDRPLDESQYVAALIEDLQQDLPNVWGRTVNTIFMGGGTPSLFSAAAMQQLMQQVRALLPLRPDAEVTMEVNPGSQEFDHFSAYLKTGINRLSFGIQSLDDAQLLALKRIHNSEQAKSAVQLAKKSGYDNFNLDMMFGLPGQTMQAAKDDLLQLIEMEPTHISYYQLTIEANTLFAVKTPENLPDLELQHDMFLQGQEVLAAHGYEQYEVSAYAKPDKRSEHNLNYWQFGDYLGIGAGAHSKITLGHNSQIQRQMKQKHPQIYLNTAGTDKRLLETRLLDESTLPFEFLLNALRLKQAFSWNKYQAVTGLSTLSLKQTFKDHVPEEWFQMDDEQLQLTTTGFLMSDEILQNFI
ncbi:Radical SAM family enzyme, similar to coproporphyrinogen III oxidase, oxygen-independent, clustered with nucleoside-triphosphatase RdgB [hydrothermal vent metagenome]|uniref:Radical SAM family enzyme, similar to coproporphyrinogen III oxidase, oxygen-independent, clustered with nucleoside-triphosphatase RdgB n=1 Tax=hydrothermal vent metagenome TaxID=652676 RepID=A0A3B0VYY4_9ZZZZ